MDYRFEKKRLESFKNWSTPYMQPGALAAAGFYYTGEIDKVRCFVCKMEICRWEEGDDPMVEHQRWTRRCRFIYKRPCGNVPIGTEQQILSETSDSVLSKMIEGLSGSMTTATARSLKESISRTPVITNSSVRAFEDQSQLVQEQHQQQHPAKKVNYDLSICKICYIEELGMVFIPCRHMACVKCGPNIKVCAMCRAPVSMVMRVFLS